MQNSSLLYYWSKSWNWPAHRAWRSRTPCGIDPANNFPDSLTWVKQAHNWNGIAELNFWAKSTSDPTKGWENSSQSSCASLVLPQELTHPHLHSPPQQAPSRSCSWLHVQSSWPWLLSPKPAAFLLSPPPRDTGSLLPPPCSCWHPTSAKVRFLAPQDLKTSRT